MLMIQKNNPNQLSHNPAFTKLYLVDFVEYKTAMKDIKRNA